MQIVSRAQAKRDNLSRYFTGLECNRGHLCERFVSNSGCVECAKLSALKRVDKIRACARENARKNQQKRAPYIAEWHRKNRERIREIAQTWRQKHKDRKNADAAKRRARKKCACPSWVDLNAIREIYKNCPDGFHVDHIIPLQSELVCGLHVPWNLQYLPILENISKSNKFDHDHVFLPELECHDTVN